jgi:hypothetical protein
MGAVLLAYDRWAAAPAGGVVQLYAFPKRAAIAVVAGLTGVVFSAA